MAGRTIVIIGGGPAGMSCALWLKNKGYAPILVERRGRLGGMQDLSKFSNTWLLGWQGVTGHELAEQFSRHLHYARIQTMLSSKVSRVEKIKSGWNVSIEKNGVNIADIIAGAIVIATGTQFVGEDWVRSVPGASECSDLIVIGPASYSDPSLWFGMRPIVIGGGDNALECASFLADRGARPTVLARGQLRAGSFYKKKLEDLIAHGAAEIKLNTFVTRLERRDRGLVAHLNSGMSILGDSLFLMLGFQPNSGNDVIGIFGERGPELDEVGFIKIRKDCKTSIPGVWAVGDVTDFGYPCVATALSMGAVAATSIVTYIEKGVEDWN